MNVPKDIPEIIGRCARLGAILLLLLLLATESAEAQRRRGSGRDRKGKSSAVQKSKKKKKSAAKARSSRATRREQSRTRTESRSRSATRERAVNRDGENRKGAATPAAQVNEGPADLAQQTLHGRSGSSLARSKRPSPGIPTLSSDQIRAINAGRQEIEGLPLRGYPEGDRPQTYTQPLYAEGSVGLYATGSLRAGYLGSSWPYDYSLHASVMGTNGFVDNATKTSFSAGGRGGYVIGDSYGIFSGGHMGAEVEYQSERYRRYAVVDAPERTRDRWSVAMTGQNTHDGTSFELKGLYRQLALVDSVTSREGAFEGSGKIRTQWAGLTVGGEADLRLTYLSGESISLGRLDAFAKYSASFFSVRAGANFGVGGNSDGSSITRLAPAAELSLFPVYGITLSAGITGGLTQSTLQGLSGINPYIVPAPVIHHEAERLGYRGAFRFEPWQSFGLHVTAARGFYDDYAYFIEVPDALFAPVYEPATITKISGDFYLELGARDMIAAQATFVETLLDSTKTQVPFVPKWSAELMYARRLADLPLTLTATARYIGERRTSAAELMSDAILLGAKGRYAFNQHIDATLELSNLANQRYELWPGYRERGFFGAVGVGVKY